MLGRLPVKKVTISGSTVFFFPLYVRVRAPKSWRQPRRLSHFLLKE